MSKIADSIRRGLEEAITFANGEADLSTHRVLVPEKVDIKAIRDRLGMTLEEFSGRFGFSINSLRHWEHGTRQPERPIRAYLVVIDRAPDVVQKALNTA